MRAGAAPIPWEDPDDVARLHELQDDCFLIALEEYDSIGTGRHGYDVNWTG